MAIWCFNTSPSHVASLPIRNWNHERAGFWLWPFGVASLPIRNWNLEKVYNGEFIEFSCEPTYKELKLTRWKIWVAERQGCEPTYKELKLWWLLQRHKGSFCCEPTYKELKRHLDDWLALAILSCEPTYKELKHIISRIYPKYWS